MTSSQTLYETVSKPVAPQRWLNAGALVGAAALVGFGIILLIAANWDDFGRFGRFGLVATVIVGVGLVTLVAPTLKAPLLLLGFAATGGMLALIGQTYQTGADAWQLFALWAVLTLPWASAARSDAIWTPWSIVAVTAIGLWNQTYAGWSWQISEFPRSVLYAAWIMALSIPAAFSPFSVLQRWTGPAHWAFRVSMVLALALITQQTIDAVFSFPKAADVAIAGLLCLAGVAATLVVRVRRDIAMLSATVLAIDAVLICGIARLIEPKHGGATGFIVIGIGAAIVIAASVVGLMRVVKEAGGSTVENDGTEALADASRTLIDRTRPWPVILLSGIGAIMAAIPFVVALAVYFGNSLEHGPAAYGVAVVVLPVALMLLRGARNLFVEQLATVGLAVGSGLLSFALFRDLPASPAGFMLAVLALAMAFWLGRTWIGALLGAMAAACMAASIVHLVPRELLVRGPYALGMAWALLVPMWVGARYVLATHRQVLVPERGQIAAHAISSGWVVAVLLGLSVGGGPTFLVGSMFGSGSSAMLDSAGLTTLIAVSRVLSVLMATAAFAWLVRETPTLRTPLGWAIAISVIGLSAAMPGLGPVALVSALALTLETSGGRRAIAIGAAAAAIWIVGNFYYELALPLTQKAAILMAAGTLLGAVAFVSGARIGFDALPVQAATSGHQPVIVRVLAALGLVLVAGLSAQAIGAKEALIRHGRPIFIELAPVDPRSLMQGDYMALRFTLPDGGLRLQPVTAPRPLAIGLLDDKGVVRLSRIGNAMTQLAPGEIKIELSPKNGRWIVVTDAWFFKEGTAKKWEAARFGELRVLPDGRALLVGLADKDRVAIR